MAVTVIDRVPTSGGVRQFLRFASWGVVNTLVDFLLYLVLVVAGLPVVAANFVSTSAGMCVSFYGNRRFVFGASGRTTRALVLFLVVAGTGVWLIQPAVILATASWLPLGDVRIPGVETWLPKAAAIAMAMVWNFLLYKHLVFRRPARALQADAT